MRTLHHTPFDPFSRQVRVALAEKGLEFDLKEERPWERDEAFLKLSPSGSTPVLVETHDQGTIAISDCRAILEFIEERRSDPPLLPRGAAERAEVRRIAGWFDRGYDMEVNATILHERIEKRLAGLGPPDAGAIRDGRDALKFHLDYTDLLAERRHWLAGETMTFADIAAAAHLSCLDYLGEIPWDDRKHAKEWYARIKSRPSFRPLLDDRLAGIAPAPVYADLDF